MSMISKAYQVARDAHEFQYDKAGVDYINHPLTVSLFTYELCMINDMDDQFIENAMTVALLHDVVEDSDRTLDSLKSEFSDTVIEALSCITHHENEPYMDYVERVKCNKLATFVKLSDLRHNMDLTRFKKITDKDRERVELKYKPALNYLLENSNIKYFL